MKRAGTVLAWFLVVAGAVDAGAWSFDDLIGSDERDESAWRDPAAPATEEQIRELGFDEEVVATVTEAIGERPRNLHGAGGESEVRIGLVWTVESSRSGSFVEELAPTLARRGYQLFLTRRSFGTADDRIGLVKTEDPLTLLRLQAVGDPDPSVTTAEIVRRLRDWDQEHPWDLVGVGPDWVEIRFRSVPDDLDRLLYQAREIAPAAVGTGTSEVDALRRVVRKSGRLLLWWEPPASGRPGEGADGSRR